MIIFFRGKAATGKSFFAQKISEKYNMAIISKDAIFDKLLTEGNSWEKATKNSYDKLAKLIQQYNDSNINVIVDIGLAHTPFFMDFFSKLSLAENNYKNFLFICSNDEVWETRINERILKTQVLNQSFTSSKEAKKYYKKYDIILLENEIEIDSAKDIDDIILDLVKHIIF